LDCGVNQPFLAKPVASTTGNTYRIRSGKNCRPYYLGLEGSRWESGSNDEDVEAPGFYFADVGLLGSVFGTVSMSVQSNGGRLGAKGE